MGHACVRPGRDRGLQGRRQAAGPPCRGAGGRAGLAASSLKAALTGTGMTGAGTGAGRGAGPAGDGGSLLAARARGGDRGGGSRRQVRDQDVDLAGPRGAAPRGRQRPADQRRDPDAAGRSPARSVRRLQRPCCGTWTPAGAAAGSRPTCRGQRHRRHRGRLAAAGIAWPSCHRPGLPVLGLVRDRGPDLAISAGLGGRPGGRSPRTSHPRPPPGADLPAGVACRPPADVGPGLRGLPAAAVPASARARVSIIRRGAARRLRQRQRPEGREAA